MMPAHSAQVLGLLSLNDDLSSQFRPYDGKTGKFYRPRKQKGTYERLVKSSGIQQQPKSSFEHVVPIIPEDEVEEVALTTGQERPLVPVGQPSYRLSRHGNLKPNRRSRLPLVTFAEPGREGDPFKVFPIAYKDCVPDACQFC
jgi:hypothetical protein